MPSTSATHIHNAVNASSNAPDTSRREDGKDGSQTGVVASTSADIPSSPPNTDMSELRQRRLQKFAGNIERQSHQETGSRSGQELGHQNNQETT